MRKTVAFLIAFWLAVPALAGVTTLSNADLLAMGDLGWGPGSLVSTTDMGAAGVQFGVTMGGAGDGKFAYGIWSGNYKDWSGDDGFALQFEYVAGPGSIELANFLGDKNWTFHQKVGSWPVLNPGDSAVVYIDFSNADPAAIPPANLNKIVGAGWQVITNDPNVLGQDITVNVAPTTVPEPAGLAMVGLCALALVRRR
jgi:MYXO-CTERM domain-containing protein